MGNDQITRNIIRTVTIFLFAQVAFFCFIAFFYKISPGVSLLFLGISVVFHVALAMFLIRMKKYFLLLETGRHLSSINLANLLTITRLSLLPTICYLLFVSQQGEPVIPLLLGVTVVAFLTDLLDGTLSRRTHQITEIGKYLDSISDYSVLIVISIAFFLYGLLPDWFFFVVMFRLFFQAVAMAVLLIGYGIKSQASILGKIAVFTTMTLYAVEILNLLNVPFLGNETLLRILEYLVGAVLVVSVFDKLHLLVTSIRNRNGVEGARDSAHET